MSDQDDGRGGETAAAERQKGRTDQDREGTTRQAKRAGIVSHE
jgi:hypothetical protein